MMNAKNVRIYCKLIFIIGIKCANLIIQLVFLLSDRYHKNPVDWLFTESRILFTGATYELELAFIKLFRKHCIVLKQNDWTEEAKVTYYSSIIKRRREEKKNGTNSCF